MMAACPRACVNQVVFDAHGGYRAALDETAGHYSAKVSRHELDDGSTAHFGVRLHMAGCHA